MALSPTTMSKSPRLKNRDYANRIRYGSPKLEEILREKYRQELRQRRAQLFNRRRFRMELDSSTQNTLTEIIRQQFKSLATTDDSDSSLKFDEIDGLLTLDEAIELENQIIQEQEQWMLEEYEKFSQEEMEYYAMFADNENSEIFCPICQKAILGQENNCVSCTACGLKLTGCTLQKMRHLINENVNIHSFNCIKIPTFMVIPDNSNLNLYLICHDCNTMALIC